MLDIFFGLTFVASAAAFYHNVAPKLSQLSAVPDHVIAERLHRENSRVRLVILHARTLYERRYHEMFFWNALGKVIHRLHILMLRADNHTTKLLRSVRSKYEAVGGKNGIEWKELVEASRPKSYPRPIEITLEE